MYGNNPVMGRRVLGGFSMHSMFYTLQGEGPFAGMPAIFVRLAGCNLRCWFCDTEFDQGAIETSLADLAQTMAQFAQANRCRFFVITGGEPLRQEVGALINHPLLAKCNFQFETAGTVWPREGIDINTHVSMVVSPKLSKVCDRIEQLVEADSYALFFKYLIRATDPFNEATGLPAVNTQVQPATALPLYAPPDMYKWKRRVYVQACDEDDHDKNLANLKRAAEVAMKYGYRLSIQMHKLAGLQ